MEKGPGGLVEFVRPESSVQKVGAHFSLSLSLSGAQVQFLEVSTKHFEK